MEDHTPKWSRLIDFRCWRSSNRPKTFATWDQLFSWDLLSTHVFFFLAVVGILSVFHFYIYPMITAILTGFWGGESDEDVPERRQDETDEQFHGRLNQHRCPMHRGEGKKHVFEGIDRKFKKK